MSYLLMYKYFFLVFFIKAFIIGKKKGLYMKKTFLSLLFLIIIGCSPLDKGQTIFYWENPLADEEWFVKDHNDCIEQADYWPWTLPAWPLNAQKVPSRKFQNESDNGVWASFVPYPGAQPLYVNTVWADWSVSTGAYQSCMQDRGYKMTREPVVRRQLIPDVER